MVHNIFFVSFPHEAYKDESQVSLDGLYTIYLYKQNKALEQQAQISFALASERDSYCFLNPSVEWFL